MDAKALGSGGGLGVPCESRRIVLTGADAESGAISPEAVRRPTMRLRPAGLEAVRGPAGGSGSVPYTAGNGSGTEVSSPNRGLPTLVGSRGRGGPRVAAVGAGRPSERPGTSRSARRSLAREPQLLRPEHEVPQPIPLSEQGGDDRVADGVPSGLDVVRGLVRGDGHPDLSEGAERLLLLLSRGHDRLRRDVVPAFLQFAV